MTVEACISWACECGFVLAYPHIKAAENIWKECPKCGKIWAINFKIEDITEDITKPECIHDWEYNSDSTSDSCSWYKCRKCQKMEQRCEGDD